MGGDDIVPKAHILAMPFPAQGHINPMLRFSHLLAKEKGLKITLLLAASISESAQYDQAGSSIHIETIDDGSGSAKQPESVAEYFQRLQTSMATSLVELIKKHSSESPSCPPSVLVYDSTMPWALDVAQGLGLRGASLFTQPCGVCAVYYHMYKMESWIPFGEKQTLELPSMPLLENKDLPFISFVKEEQAFKVVEKLLLDQYSNIDKVDWIFFNTFDELEPKVSEWMKSQWDIKTIGPTVPSLIYQDKPTSASKFSGIDIFKPEDEACMKWLNTMEASSVVYVSFGSAAILEEEQIEEIAEGLIKSNCNFLWVVREKEDPKLPKNFKTLEEVSERGLVVNWAPQLDVLAHPAVAGFLSHCGWNSTLEALCLGVPMVAMPQWVDQTTNAKFIEDVWEVGVRVKVNEKGIGTREEIELCIKEVMQGERGKDLRRNALKWKNLASQALGEGGSSERNIKDFVSNISSF